MSHIRRPAPAGDMHFNLDPGGDCKMQTLLQKTDFQPRAWRELLNRDLIELTSKILFDSKTNFKTISLCVTLSEASVSCDLGNDSTTAMLWMERMMDFFTG